MWINGAVVKDKLRGPDVGWGESWRNSYYISTPKGENILIVKVAPSHALDWRFGLQYFNVFKDELK